MPSFDTGIDQAINPGIDIAQQYGLVVQWIRLRVFKWYKTEQQELFFVVCIEQVCNKKL